MSAMVNGCNDGGRTKELWRGNNFQFRWIALSGLLGTILGPGHQSMSFDSADENQGTVFAQAPFDHVDAADIIIRSSDGMHFRMIKLLLSLVSPIFKDLFNLPRSTEEEGIDETKDGLPIVDLTEKSGTIKNILSFCYPAIYNGDVGLETLSEVSALLEAMQKYEMGEIRKVVAQRLTKPRFLEQNPLRVYAIACQHKLEAVALLAAKHTLRRPALEDAYFPELLSIDAGKLYSVLQYRKECGETAMQVASSYLWITPTNYTFFGCSDHTMSHFSVQFLSAPSRKHKYGYEYDVSVHPWWSEYMKSTRVALQSSSCGETAKDATRVDCALAEATKCSACRPAVAAHFRQFVNTFAKEIDQRISEVQAHSPLRLHLEF
jgi:hypothetical protein